MNFYYYLIGILGLASAVLLVYFYNENPDAVSIHQSQQPIVQLKSASAPRYPELMPSVTENQLKKLVAQNGNTQLADCNSTCSSTLSMLDSNTVIDDEAFHRLGAYVDEIASYLQHDQAKRQHYLQMALTTTNADKRSFLTDVFMYLPDEQRALLGKQFISSENWQVRADGVTLIADHGISNLVEARTLMNTFSNEENPYIKSTILTYLEQSSSLQGDAEILHQLDSAIYNETDPAVRVAALKAKMQLSEQTYHILPDALQALRANEPELQLAGLVAIEQVLQKEQEYIERGHHLDVNSIKNEFNLIRELDAYGDNKKHFERLIEEANMIYLRYFKE